MIDHPLLVGASHDWLKQNMQRALRLAVVVGLLLFNVVIAFKASDRLMMLLLGLPPAIGLLLVLLKWPQLGLLAIIGAMVVGVDGPSGLNATMMVVAMMLGLRLLDNLVQGRTLQLVPSRTMRPLLAFLIVSGLAFGVGQLPWFLFAQPAPIGAQVAGLSIFILSAGAFILAAHQIQELKWLKWLTWTFFLFSGLYIAGRLVPPLGQITQQLYPGSSSGSMFWTWLAAMAASQALLNKSLHWRWRLAIGGLLVATLYVAYVQTSGWKSGWVPPLAALVAIVALRSWRLGLAMAVGGLVLVPGLLSDLISTDRYSYSTRVDAWLIVVEIIKVNPILGLGPANYRWYTPLFPIRGYAVQFNSHNQYVDLVAQTGLLGLACFFWFFWEVGRLGWQLRERVPAGFAQAYVYGALGGVCGTLVAAMLGDWVLPFFYNVTLRGFRSSVLAWLFMGGLVALEQIVRRSGQDRLVGEV